MQTRQIKMIPEVKYQLSLIVDENNPADSKIAARVSIAADGYGKHAGILSVAKHPDIQVFGYHINATWGAWEDLGWRSRAKNYPLDTQNVALSLVAINQDIITELTPLVTAILDRKATIARIESEFSSAVKALGLGE